MNFEKLQKLSDQTLADYVWRRLRLEPPLAPPLSIRFGDEPPELFLVEAVKHSKNESFRRRMITAIHDNLSQLSRQAFSIGLTRFWDDQRTDQQIASIAFLISLLKASELVPALFEFTQWRPQPSELTDGQFHVIRTIAQLQQGRAFAGLWPDLWEHGPWSLRGLIFFGWSRADSNQALQRLNELVDSADRIDLPTTLWSLIGPEGPGTGKLALAAAKYCDETQRDKLRQALIEAGADQQTLEEFDRIRQSSPGRIIAAPIQKSEFSPVKL